MAADNEQEDKSEADEDEETEHVSADLVTEEELKEEEKEKEPEDEVTILKKEIASLEATLKSKRNTVQYTKDTAEEYSKAGYARKVAEMENMRRVRSVSLSYNYIVEQNYFV
jgi:molecular chaperone GrpE (heat shock protein)